jgi:hypothetical protein
MCKDIIARGYYYDNYYDMTTRLAKMFDKKVDYELVRAVMNSFRAPEDWRMHILAYENIIMNMMKRCEPELIEVMI